MRRIVKIYYYFDEEDKKAFKDLLKANEITQEQFAKIIGISNAYLSAILNGKRSCPDVILCLLQREGVSECLKY